MRCLSYAEALRQKPAFGQFYAIFHVFWCRQSDLPAASGRTGRYQPLACLCGPCRQRRRACPLRAWWLWHGQVVWIKLAGRVHPVFAMVFTILVYLSIGPCLAIPAPPVPPSRCWCRDRRRYRAAAGPTRCCFCSGLSGGATAGKAYRLAGRILCPGDRAHRGAVCRVSHPSAGGTLRHTQRRVRSSARCAGHPVRLPDHGHAGRAEFWRGHRPEHPRPGVSQKAVPWKAAPSGPVLLQAG